MKHLIETEDLSGLGNVKYDRLILDSTKNEIIYRGGVINANGHSYVDLGLPSGTLWATMNVGATSETDYGDYFMWGSTTPNTDTPCDWEHAPFNNGSSSYNETYFNSVKDDVCPNGILAKKYDAAAQIMGGNWRMPTNADFRELYKNTTNRWVTINGVDGIKFTSKTDTSKYIFIPASLERSVFSTYVTGPMYSIWSSSLDPSFPSYAEVLYFDSYTIRTAGGNSRSYGLPVRGVCN